MPLDLEQHLLRQMAFSRATFGPGERRAGVSDHIRKELAEVAACKGPAAAAEEWVDVVILALDGLTRALQADPWRKTPEDAAAAAIRGIVAKQTANESRTWPDWRTADPDKAIEHDRTAQDGSE